MTRFLFRAPAVLTLHIALGVIVAGAIITHFFGIQGKLTLEEGATPVSRYTVESGPSDGVFPFTVALEECEVVCYPHTSTPADFMSRLVVELPDGGPAVRGTVAMNRVFSIRGWRFYQTGIGPSSSVLTVAHDPVGIAVTYTGYMLLGISMIWIFLAKGTSWRAALRGLSATAMLAACLMPAVAQPRTIQRPLAREMGKLLVFDHDRVRPLSAMARDFTVALTGSDSYRGLTSEQVLAGWLFYYDEWKHEPMIRVDGSEVKRALATSGSHVPLTAFFGSEGYRLSALLSDRTCRRALEADARVASVSAVATGSAFTLFPYVGRNGSWEWLSWSDKRPAAMDDAVWELISGSLPSLNGLVRRQRNLDALDVFRSVAAYQDEMLGASYSGIAGRARAEILYYRYVRLFPLAGLLVVVGFVSLIMVSRRPSGWRLAPLAVYATAVAAAVALLAVFAARWYITGHIPLSNGHETMMAMSIIALLMCVAFPGRLLRCTLMLVSGLALLVAAISANTPQMASLVPVLASPWLSLHVLLVMAAYALAALLAVLGLVVLCSPVDARTRPALLMRVVLLPAVCLLAAGIFVGAVWANQSWGRYWGWDPKETCALITMLLYALPLHRRSLKWFASPRNLAIYLSLAFLSVLFTYFGANYLLPGLHSYA